MTGLPVPRTLSERDAYLAGWTAALDLATTHDLDFARRCHQMVLDADARIAQDQRQKTAQNRRAQGIE